MPAIDRGDVVYLKSGSPPLRVEDVGYRDVDGRHVAHLRWTDVFGAIQQCVLPIGCLTFDEPDEDDD